MARIFSPATATLIEFEESGRYFVNLRLTYQIVSATVAIQKQQQADMKPAQYLTEGIRAMTTAAQLGLYSKPSGGVQLKPYAEIIAAQLIKKLAPEQQRNVPDLSSSSVAAPTQGQKVQELLEALRARRTRML